MRHRSPWPSEALAPLSGKDTDLSNCFGPSALRREPRLERSVDVATDGGWPNLRVNRSDMAGTVKGTRRGT